MMLIMVTSPIVSFLILIPQLFRVAEQACSRPPAVRTQSLD
jgi:hypothetical protein